MVQHDSFLESILKAPHRSDAHRARDQYRHPAEVFSFFGLKPTSTVVDLWPGSAGWTTEILAPYLKANGLYAAAGYDPASETSFDATPHQAEFVAKLAANPELYGAVRHGRLSPTVFDLGAPGSVDIVLAFRLHHIFMANKYLDRLTAAVFKVLKSGGVFGVEEHREDASRDNDPTGARGYVRQEFVIAETVKAGFVCEATSEISANPRDAKNYPKSVWSLPPWMWDVPESDKPLYRAIGESDRMVLKFRKP